MGGWHKQRHLLRPGLQKGWQVYLSLDLDALILISQLEYMVNPNDTALDKHREMPGMDLPCRLMCRHVHGENLKCLYFLALSTGA